MNIYLQILLIGAVAIGLITAIYITGQRRMSNKPFLDMTSPAPAKRKPLPSDFMPGQKDLRRRAALDNLPTIYFTDRPKSQADPVAVAKAEAEGKIILFNVKSLDDLADRFEENEREIIRRHKEEKR